VRPDGRQWVVAGPSEISLETAACEAVTDNAFPARSERWSVTAHLAKAIQVIVSPGPRLGSETRCSADGSRGIGAFLATERC
jgi:hypothetical protein